MDRNELFYSCILCSLFRLWIGSQLTELCCLMQLLFGFDIILIKFVAVWVHIFGVSGAIVILYPGRTQQSDKALVPSPPPFAQSCKNIGYRDFLSSNRCTRVIPNNFVLYIFLLKKLWVYIFCETQWSENTNEICRCNKGKIQFIFQNLQTLICRCSETPTRYISVPGLPHRCLTINTELTQIYTELTQKSIKFTQKFIKLSPEIKTRPAQSQRDGRWS